MSALAGTTGGTVWRRPSLPGLTWAVLCGEIPAAILLWIGGIALGVLGVAPLGGAQQWVWLPWRIDGPWALVGAIGWGYLVCSLVAWQVGGALARRGFDRPAAAWLRAAVAISGYGAMAVSERASGRVFVAVVAGALIIRAIAFQPDGSARGWRWHPPRRARLAAVLVALLAALSYSGTHAFAVDGDGGTHPPGVVAARVGHTETVAVQLRAVPLASEITSVTLSGSGAAHARVSGLLMSTGQSPPLLIPPRLRHQPGARGWPGYAWSPTRLPYRLPAGSGAWISLRVTLSSCGSVRLNSLRLRYTVLGIATQETIPLQSPPAMRCRQ